jgi:acylglycerol lipase
MAAVKSPELAPRDKEELLLNSVWNGYALRCYSWYPSSNPARAMVYIAHGVTEHMGRYDEFAILLADSGLCVFGHDHVGHGHSDGERVHVENIDTYVQDVINHVELMKSKYPHLPYILMGHSMGGLIVAHATILRGDMFAGLVLSAAAVRPVVVSPVTAAIVNFGAKSLAFVMPRVPLFPWKTSNITSLPEEVKCYEEDSLTHCGMMKPAWTASMMDSMSLLSQSLHKITLPVLLIHGARDPVVSYSSSEFVYKNLSSKDKTFLRFDGFHDVLHDVEQEKAKLAIRDWIIKHLALADAIDHSC